MIHKGIFEVYREEEIPRLLTHLHKAHIAEAQSRRNRRKPPDNRKSVGQKYL